MTEFYSPDNLSHIYPYLPREPKWLLLGGVADAYECQTAVAKWPGIRVVGVEPNANAVKFQRENGWPRDQLLLRAALWDTMGMIEFDPKGDLRHGSVVCSGMSVPSITWDYLNLIYGPFEDAVLWMDIEGSEWKALQGAENLLNLGSIMLINVEMLSQVAIKNQLIDKMLVAHGFKNVNEWNWSPDCWDRIYVRG